QRRRGWTAATADTPSAGIKPAPQGVRGEGAGPWGREEWMGAGLSRPAKAGLDRSDRRHAVGRHIAGPHRGCGARARVLVAGKNLWGRVYPGQRRRGWTAATADTPSAGI